MLVLVCRAAILLNQLLYKLITAWSFPILDTLLLVIPLIPKGWEETNYSFSGFMGLTFCKSCFVFLVFLDRSFDFWETMIHRKIPDKPQLALGLWWGLLWCFSLVSELFRCSAASNNWLVKIKQISAFSLKSRFPELLAFRDWTWLPCRQLKKKEKLLHGYYEGKSRLNCFVYVFHWNKYEPYWENSPAELQECFAAWIRSGIHQSQAGNAWGVL